ncbi:enoyl-CoA hydratase/isomerase family protein [Luteimonas notoginsengisoli]|uniref:Enoyl-CoA hydratase/isomerase family protein n=1 Tax=Luteimonas notoginsengisoli TaxID=1578200 RepID=A0ABV7UXN6_9GAMM
MTTLIKRTDHGDIRELQLDRAPVNALNPMVCTQLVEAIDEAVAAGVGGIVLSGGPKVFSAGLDVPFLLGLSDRDALRAAWEQFFEAARALATCPVPVVAAINGHAPAGGCVLALCCDYRVMADGPYRIGLNETQVGLVAPDGIQRLMRRAVGAHRAECLLVSGELVESGQALAWGLVDELTDIGGVPTRALAWLEQLLQLPRKPVLATRAIARADLVEALHPDNIRLDHFIEAWNDPDTQAGLRALVAKLGK